VCVRAVCVRCAVARENAPRAMAMGGIGKMHLI
jgi:hypothetical protein